MEKIKKEIFTQEFKYICIGGATGLVFGIFVLLGFMYLADDTTAFPTTQAGYEDEGGNIVQEATVIKEITKINPEQQKAYAQDLEKSLTYVVYYPGVYHNPKSKLSIELMKYFAGKSIEISDLEKLDYDSDRALRRFLSEQDGFSDKGYQPEDLQPIEESETIQVNEYHADKSYLLRKDAYDALQELSAAYYAIFEQPLRITSSRRSYKQQEYIFRNCPTPTRCASPGHSEHQTGFAVDIAGMYGKRLIWMQNNAHRFGFHQSYQGKSPFSDYEKEDWHRRYIGEGLATYLYEHNLTLSERYHSF